MALDGDEAIGIAQAVIIGLFRGLVLLFLADVSPDFIALNLFHRNIHDQTAHERGALLSSMYEKPQDRVTMQPSDSLGGPHTGTLYKQLERKHSLFHGHPQFAKRIGFDAGTMRLCVGFLTAMATEAAQSIAVTTKGAAFGFASGAIHRRRSPLYHVFMIQQALVVVNCS
jgi:hypothetical protein